MIKIKHRVNTIENLRELSSRFGVEVDIRSQGKNLIIHHEPFSRGISFEKWIKFYKHKFLILNVKEEGLEQSLINLMKENNIENYFFLDQSFPFMIKFSKNCKKRSAIRLSEYEDINTCIKVSSFCKWVWIDCFNKFLLDKKTYNRLKDRKLKICLVSPELQGRYDKNEIRCVLDHNIKNNIKIDAVCTKFPELWNYTKITS